ncbi:hypothetical protein NMY22_g19797 [Coprinellus aureogranulatus]|nr:hypothetical protein NMY22_g19797 [Coprinellus aureogranulatus]
MPHQPAIWYKEVSRRALLLPVGEAEHRMVAVPIVDGGGEQFPVVSTVLAPQELTRSTKRAVVRLLADTDGRTCPTTAVKGPVLVMSYDSVTNSYSDIASAVEVTAAMTALKGFLNGINALGAQGPDGNILVVDPMSVRI